MSTGIGDYREGDTVQLLVKSQHIGTLMTDWVERSMEADIRVRRAKTRDCVVIETKNVIYASHVVQWYPDVQVHFKKRQ